MRYKNNRTKHYSKPREITSSKKLLNRNAYELLGFEVLRLSRRSDKIIKSHKTIDIVYRVEFKIMIRK
jgi:hypothetical protein